MKIELKFGEALDLELLNSVEDFLTRCGEGSIVISEIPDDVEKSVDILMTVCTIGTQVRCQKNWRLYRMLAEVQASMYKIVTPYEQE